MEIVEFGPLSDEQRAQLEGDEVDPFDAAGVQLAFRRKDRHVGLREGGRLVASTGLLEVEAQAGAERFAVVGIGGVIVAAEHRGRGLGRRVVEAALGRARGLGPRFAILFCHADRAGLYERLGFSELAPPVLVAQPDGFAEIAQRTMWLALAPGAAWPPGAIVVHSLPF
jgi:predicted N-acetyltransferase YhbS